MKYIGFPRPSYPLGLSIERVSLHFTYFEGIKLQILGQMRDNNKTAKIHTTNYFNTFIEVADDCISDIGLIPPQKGDIQSIANFQFDLNSKNLYTFTSDDILFMVSASKMDLIEDEYADARKGLFSRGQACLRFPNILPKKI